MCPDRCNGRTFVVYCNKVVRYGYHLFNRTDDSERSEAYKKVCMVLNSKFPNLKIVLKGSVGCTLYSYIFDCLS